MDPFAYATMLDVAESLVSGDGWDCDSPIHWFTIRGYRLGWNTGQYDWPWPSLEEMLVAGQGGE